MSHITVAEANAWFESTKLALTSIESELEAQVASSILSRLTAVFDVSAWIDQTSTPKLVRSIIAMYYCSWVYDRAYSDDAKEENDYANLLRRMAEANILGLLSGVIVIPESPDNADVGVPTFFPNDLSSSLEPTPESPSDGGPAFMMGTVF